ncbi:MAG: hypothetical protein ACREL7_13865 [Longimicrobiales bacterium]
MQWARLLTFAFATVAACDDSPPGPVDEQPTREIHVFFTRDGQPAPVTRSIFPTFNPLPVAMSKLLEGPTPEERTAGFSSFFFIRTAPAFDRLEVRPDSLAVIDFLDFSHIIPEASSAAGAAMLLGELNHTVFQFSFIKSVVYRFNGSCTRFFDWLGQACQTIRRDAIE